MALTNNSLTKLIIKRHFSFLLLMLLYISSTKTFALTCNDLDGATVFSQEPTPIYLGFFGSDFAFDSINNQFGTYGSTFSSSSVRNTFGTYGSQFSLYSANNSFTSSPPVIFKGNVFLAYLTTNSFLLPTVSLNEIDSTCGTFFSNVPYVEPGPISPDVTPPQLLEWDVTPTTVDVTNQAQIITVIFRVADDISGTNTPSVSARSINTTQTSGFAQVQLVSGDRIDGIWLAQITIPARSAPGQWKISLFPLEDSIGNSTSFGPGVGFPSEFTVISGTGTVKTELAAALLPASRSVQVGSTATAFAAIINTGGVIARDCGISQRTSIPSAFSYQTTDPSTNALNGTPDTSVDIAVGRLQTFVLAFTPTAAFNPTEVQLNLDCTNTDPAPVVFGLNTLLLSSSSTPVPDIVALAAAPSGDGVVRLPGATASNAFAVATVNVGSTSTITASADTGSTTLLAVLSICETNSITGICTEPPAASVTTTISANATPTFSVFVNGMGSIPFDPTNNRIHVRFKDGDGVTRGSTSVAVSTQ